MLADDFDRQDDSAADTCGARHDDWEHDRGNERS
jgi:hypothetical protein